MAELIIVFLALIILSARDMKKLADSGLMFELATYVLLTAAVITLGSIYMLNPEQTSIIRYVLNVFHVSE
ncbi:MAG: hypothetical protein LBN30_08315 [Oscillospiraceae bacterium]|jgi:hypothetical protein|nr:hypothetical protein [Oscillospiraceae bacterium]